MKTLLVFGMCVALLLSTGCVNMITKGDAYPSMYEEKPTAILVVPALNNSTAADAPDLYSSTITEPLANAGFYVLPFEVTQRFLRNEGFTEGYQIKDIPPQKFQGLFGADAVLYVTITKWDTAYWVLGGNVTVGADYELKSTKTGATLWAHKSVNKINTGGDSGGGILGAIITTAIKTSTQDYVPIARNINLTAMQTMPAGKYNKQHDKDQKVEFNKGFLVSDKVSAQ